ncbi:MAG TPA: hypothetical protein VES20_06295, partial [Bryobacteraceae bacterium]|nr:hypothetical protein [Bryobacteraceae bacterium]
MSIPAPGMTRYVAVVEDNVSDVELVRYALTAAGVETRLQIFADGDEAYRLIAEVESGAAPCPILFLLDLN